MSYLLCHISICVQWHDAGWDGHVCAAPRLNGSCLQLKSIEEDRDDAVEEAVAGTLRVPTHRDHDEVESVITMDQNTHS